jgi:hypothetical protein
MDGERPHGSPAATTAFHCSAEWHLARLDRYAVPIHCLMLKVQDDHFFGSEKQMAEYFHAGRRHIHDAVLKLIDSGFVLKIAARKGNSTIYRALTHKEWAENHPGQCAAKRDSAGQNNLFGGAPKGSMSPKGSPPVPPWGHKSPKKSPKEKRYDASLRAAVSALRLFRQSMDDKTALNQLRWILARAAHPEEGPEQVPQTLKYYRKAWSNFQRQHPNDAESVLAEAAGDRFDKFARDFLAEKSPDLLDWLEDKEAEMYEAEIREAPMSDPLDELPF